MHGEYRSISTFPVLLSPRPTALMRLRPPDRCRTVREIIDNCTVKVLLVNGIPAKLNNRRIVVRITHYNISNAVAWVDRYCFTFKVRLEVANIREPRIWAPIKRQLRKPEGLIGRSKIAWSNRIYPYRRFQPV